LSFAAGPFFACAVILVVAGVAKMRSPRAASTALTAVGIPAPVGLVRVAAGAEIALGIAALLRPVPLVALGVALAYVCFALVSAVFLWSPRVRSCGCLGDKEVPPSVAHVALNAAAVAVAVVAVATGVASLPTTMRALGWSAPAFVLSVGVLAYLAQAVVTLFPAAFAAYRGEHDHGRRSEGGAVRLQRTEDALRSAGVGADHPSLWGGTRPEVVG
jgi:hypothetical protein